jgi:hypothetical protein
LQRSKASAVPDNDEQERSKETQYLRDEFRIEHSRPCEVSLGRSTT